MAPTDTDSDATGNITIAVQLAKLTGKVDQVIGDHERRITTLETNQRNAGSRLAGMWGPIVAGLGLLILVAGKINWT